MNRKRERERERKKILHLLTVIVINHLKKIHTFISIDIIKNIWSLDWTKKFDRKKMTASLLKRLIPKDRGKLILV